MKPYKRPAKFNAFPPRVPRWGRHRHRYYNPGRVPKPSKPSKLSESSVPDDLWMRHLYESNKLHDGWRDGNSQNNMSLMDILYLCCIIPLTAITTLICSCGFFGLLPITGFIVLSAKPLIQFIMIPRRNIWREEYKNPLIKLLAIVLVRPMWLSDGVSYDNDDALLDRETKAVMKERVAASTRSGYESRNVTFMCWLFDNGDKYNHLIEPNFLSKMESAHTMDKARRTKRGQPCKLRDNIRHSCSEALQSIDASDPSTIPIELEGLTFTIFTRFLAQFKKTVKTRNIEGNVVVGEDEHTIRLQPSSYNGACSALSHFFTESGISKEKTKNTEELWNNISSYKKGTRRLSTKERKELGLSTTEGKKPLPFRAYKHLARILFESEKPEHVAAHTFLLLEWNLISRAEYVVNSKIDAVKMEEDALLFDIGKTKTDQEGTKNIDHPWHVYANPQNPYICTVLAMARHLMCNPTILNGQCDLFEGSSQYERFNKIFIDIINDDEYREVFTSLGMPPDHFGTHSIRKGAVTHVATGSTSSPPIASICLRANWAMPGVMNRYIKFEYAGDQFVGKSVSGRNRMKKDFAESCAYFDFSGCTKVEKEESEGKLHTWIKDRMPEVAKSNENVFGVFKMCIASFMLHRQFLNENLHRNSSVRTSIFMIETPPYANNVTTKYPWDQTSDTPEITGIPPDVMILAEFQEMKLELSNLRSGLESSFKQSLKDELDARDVGGSGYAQANEMMTKLDKLIQWAENGQPLLQQNYPDEERDDNPLGFYFEEEEDIVLPMDSVGPNRDIVSSTWKDVKVKEETKEQLQKRQLSIGYHHGQLNPLPSAWQYPTGMTLIQLINLWLIGIRDENVPPLYMVRPTLVSHFDHGSRQYSKMKQVMKNVERFGRDRGIWVKFNEWDGEKVTKLWSAIWHDFDPYLRTETQRQKNAPASLHKSRQGQQSWVTTYNKLGKAGKLKINKKRQREETDDVERERMVEDRRKKRAAAKAAESREARSIAMKLAERMKRPLTLTEKEIVKRAIWGNGAESDVLAQQNSDCVKRTSMKTLHPEKWLNDEVISYFLKTCLSNRDKNLCAKQPGRRRSHFFNSFFTQSMFDEKNADSNLRGKYCYSNVASWGTKVPGGDIFGLKYIICPINVENVHWISAVVFMEEKRIQMYDSKGGTDMIKLQGIFQYLQDEYRTKKGGELDANEWALVGCTRETPRQQNGKSFKYAMHSILPLVFSPHLINCY